MRGTVFIERFVLFCFVFGQISIKEIGLLQLSLPTVEQNIENITH